MIVRTIWNVQGAGESYLMLVFDIVLCDVCVDDIVKAAVRRG